VPVPPLPFLGIAAAAKTPVAVDALPGSSPRVQVFDAQTHELKLSFLAYDPQFTGGVRTAVGDVNGDGVPDIITAPGPGGGPDIRVFDGKTGVLVRQFFAFDRAFTGGAYVATGDVNGDGASDIIVGAGQGGGPNIVVVSGKDGTVLQDFFAYDSRFTGGVHVAAGDVNDDGFADIITGAGPGGGPNVMVINGNDGAPLDNFFAFDAAFTGGVFVGAGDVNGDGHADVITGAGADGGPNVIVFSATDLTELSNFMADAPDFTGGVPIAAMLNNGQKPALVIDPSTTGGQVEILDPLSGATIDSFFAQNQDGMNIAATAA
jgi:hypothetical protein